MSNCKHLSPVGHQQYGQSNQQTQQQLYYAGNEGKVVSGITFPSVPQTPFDPTYGASLLPSHMLMGSPFLSNLIRPQGAFHSTSLGQSNYSMYHSLPSRFSYVYPQQHILKIMSPRRKKSFSLNNDVPCEINFKIMPKGKDEYMTRSLLFTNLENQDNFDLHGFLTNFIKYESIESVYLLDDNHSVLLSFLTKEICLGFYNNLLQRFSEFKSKLCSPKLSVNFVCLDEKNWFKSLQINVITRGATRSLCIEFDDQTFEMTRELVHEKFPWLFYSQRYLVERIDAVNATPNLKFAGRYLLIHFICIKMALDVDDYLQQPLKKKQLGISKIQFVNVNGHLLDHLDDETFIASNGIKEQDFRSSLMSSIFLSMSNFSEVNELFDSLDQTLDIISLQVIPSEYPEPLIKKHSEHLSYITLSKPSKSLNFSSYSVDIYSPMTNGATSNGSNVLKGTVVSNDPFLAGSNFPIATSELNATKQSLQMGMTGKMLSGSPSIHVQTPKDRLSASSIMQNLQRQYLTGASQVNGMNNRTIYIGNIHPRSKPEDICNVVRGGILQHIKWITSKRICFITFVEAAAAVQFYSNAILEPTVLHGNVLKVGWGQPSVELPKNIALAVSVGASRNVYVSLPDYSFKEKYINNPEFKVYRGKYSLPTEEQLRYDFTKYGQIEQINYLEDGHCCWINFMSIAYAIRLVEDSTSSSSLNLDRFHAQFDDRYRDLIIGYGKDRCGNVNKNLAINQASQLLKREKGQAYNTGPYKQSKGEIGSLSSKSFGKQDNLFSKVEIKTKGVTNDDLNELKNKGKGFEGPGVFLNHTGVTNNRIADLKYDRCIVGNGYSQIKNANGTNSHRTAGHMKRADSTAVRNSEDQEEDAGYSTSGSFDIDIIVFTSANNDEVKRPAPIDFKDKKKSRTNKTQQKANQNIKNLYTHGSFDPTLSDDALHHKCFSTEPSTKLKFNERSSESSGDLLVDQTQLDCVRCGNSNNSGISTRPRRKARSKFSKPIAGHDIMNQYLDQLNHYKCLYVNENIGPVIIKDSSKYYERNGNQL